MAQKFSSHAVSRSSLQVDIANIVGYFVARRKLVRFMHQLLLEERTAVLVYFTIHLPSYPVWD